MFSDTLLALNTNTLKSDTLNFDILYTVKMHPFLSNEEQNIS